MLSEWGVQKGQFGAERESTVAQQMNNNVKVNKILIMLAEKKEAL